MRLRFDPSSCLRACLVLGLVAGCDRGPPVREFDGAAAFRFLQTQVAFGPRIPGTEGHRAWRPGWIRSWRGVATP